MRYASKLMANRYDLQKYAEELKLADRSTLEAECLELATQLKNLSDIEKSKLEAKQYILNYILGLIAIFVIIMIGPFIIQGIKSLL